MGIKLPLNMYTAVVYALMTDLLYTFSIGLSMLYLFDEKPVTGIQNEPVTLSVYGWVLLGSVFEEMVFRYAPLRLIERFNLKTVWVVPIAIISSMTFGYIHGFVLSAIFIQGVGGLIYFTLGYYVLKKKDSETAWLMCSITHCSYNSILIAGLYLTQSG